MNFLKNLLLIFLVLLFFSSCTNDSSPATETIASNICDCTQPLVKLNEEIDALKEKGKIDELVVLMEKAGKINEQVIKCAQKNDFKKIKKDALKKALIRSCDMNKRMVEGLVLKLKIP